ncbi:hypothetical protein A3850_012175 [Lewinella sp. 4G2]|nr:hypothetical protein A3850_012175 [Lewinella sp. 4G2]
MRAVILLLLALCSAPAAAQDFQYSILTLPEKLKENANSVVRDLTYDYVVYSDRESTVTVTETITILNSKHASLSDVSARYDKGTSRVTKLEAEIFGPLGEKLGKLKKSAINDFRAVDGFDGNGRVMYASMEYAKYPYTIVKTYEKKMEGIGMVMGAPSVAPLQYDQSLQQATIRVTVPASVGLNVQGNNIPEPTISGSDPMVYEWKLADIPAVSHEVLAPVFSQQMPFLITTFKKFNADGYEGSFSDWNQLGQFMQQLYVDRDVLTPELKALVHQVTDDKETNFAKIDALYRLMQERTRYISVQLGIGGWQPFPVSYVEENRYGDCKALSNYMAAMLNEIGIESYHVLVEAGDEVRMPKSEEFANPYFNHMILYVPAEDMYLECTSSNNPTGYLGSFTEGRTVLHVTPEGGRLAEIPRTSPAENGQLQTLAVTVLEDGGAELDFHNHYFGTTHDRYRNLQDELPDQREQIKALHRTGTIPDVHGSTYELSVVPDAPEAKLHYHTKLNKYARSMGKRMFIPVNKYSAYGVPERLEKRRTEVRSEESRFYVDTVRITLPNNMEIESLGPERIDLDHAAGEYRSTIAVKGNQLEWVRTLKLVPFNIPATEYDSYREFFLDAAKADGRQVVVKERRTK